MQVLLLVQKYLAVPFLSAFRSMAQETFIRFFVNSGNTGIMGISYAEFLYQQSRYIHKRWWVLQGLLLLLLYRERKRP